MIQLNKLIDSEVSGVTDDSREVKKGFVFVAVNGEHFDGNDFVKQAISKGASVVVSQATKPKNWPENIEYLKVPNAREALGLLASNFYGNPSNQMFVIGVTGSDGKTTTSHMIYEILKKAKKSVGLISTISAKMGNTNIDTGFHVTNPEAVALQKILSKMLKSGVKYVVLETTSHGIDQERIAGIKFDFAVLTNITHEHLDYHKTFKNYRDTKLKLFKRARVSVLNRDDKSFLHFKKNIKGEIITYSIQGKADVTKNDLDIKKLMGQELKAIGDYNLQNALAATALARSLEIPFKIIKQALAEMKPPKGRLEKIANDRGVDLYIDFAHTPNALRVLLQLLKKRTRGKLIVVFGCAGERDKQKRPMMARIATDIADFSVFTAEDPRCEDVANIIAQMEAGVRNKKSKRFTIAQRGEAITFAIHELSRANDTVVIAGKAHERSMAYNGVEHPWSDYEAVEMALVGKTLRIKK